MIRNTPKSQHGIKPFPITGSGTSKVEYLGTQEQVKRLNNTVTTPKGRVLILRR
jgi:hypothetical protein